jgi:tetratricopeptide (TPR) repeat protein
MRALAHLALVEAGLGREEACRTHGGQALTMAAREPSAGPPALARAALGLLELELGRFEAAVACLEPLGEDPSQAPDTWAADLAEALIRGGEPDRAEAVLAQACARLRTHAPRARRALERSRGLLAPDDAFDAHFAQALNYSHYVDEPFERARTELCLGQRLGQTGRRTAARGWLCSALRVYERLGAAFWIENTRREIGACAPPRGGATRRP